MRYGLTITGELLLKARTELAAIDLETGKIRKAETVGFDPSMENPVQTEGLDFSRFSKTCGSLTESVTVRSTSLDYCYHTNNIEYVRFMLNTYPVEHFKTHEPAQLEIHYASQSFEGEVLSIMKESDDSGDQFHVLRDSQEITSARIRWV